MMIIIIIIIIITIIVIIKGPAPTPGTDLQGDGEQLLSNFVEA
jgi:hypothetical protein